MSKAIEAGRISAKGGFNLFVGMAVSNIVMAMGTVIIDSFLGDINYETYATALIPFHLFTQKAQGS